jgi:hypothetical protein
MIDRRSIRSTRPPNSSLEYGRVVTEDHSGHRGRAAPAFQLNTTDDETGRATSTQTHPGIASGAENSF